METIEPAMYVHKWDGTVRYVVTQNEEAVAHCAEMANLVDNTIYFYADDMPPAWTCDMHRIKTHGDCPKCDAEMISLTEEEAS